MIEFALRALEAHFGLVRRSGLHHFPAWPDPADPPFVNAAAVLRPGPGPSEVLAGLHAVEAAFGRRRECRNAPRTLDLDLLAYGPLIQAGPPVLPHPGLEVRDFVLTPLVEIAPEFRSPQSGRTVKEMLAQVTA